MKPQKKVVLMIIDGWGVREEKKGNAIAQARTPFYNRLIQEYPYTLLQASETFVGLPKGVMGNSEVGHMNIGAGRRVVQDQVRINESIENGDFFSNSLITKTVEEARANQKKIHLVGLVSDGCVHSSERHYLSLIDLIRRKQFPAERLWVHAILDGRDTPPKSSIHYLSTLQQKLATVGGNLATLIGRFYAMDRDKRWERTEKAYLAMVKSEGHIEKDPILAIHNAYARNETDEFVTPVVLSGGKGAIEKGDTVIFFNFRADRMRQIVRALSNQEHGIPHRVENLHLSSITFTEYDKSFGLPVVYRSQDLSLGLGECVAHHGLKQFRTAETEKYAHVTFFLNGGREAPFSGETRKLVPSPKVRTYDEIPEMSSKIVTEGVVSEIEKNESSLIVVNYAQPDMVGHTGNFDAAVSAVEATEACIRDVVSCGLDKGWNTLITADHGNIEMMIDPATGEPHTAHTTNPVPFICVGSEIKSYQLKSGGVLSDISPTVLTLLGLDIPSVMTSKNLLSR